MRSAGGFGTLKSMKWGAQEDEELGRLYRVKWADVIETKELMTLSSLVNVLEMVVEFEKRVKGARRARVARKAGHKEQLAPVSLCRLSATNPHTPRCFGYTRRIFERRDGDLQVCWLHPGGKASSRPGFSWCSAYIYVYVYV